MPKGRSRKQSAEAELLPPEEADQLKVKEVKHTATWIEQRPVEDALEDDGADFDDDDSEDRPKRKVRNAREELRKKLRAQGVSPSTNLRLYIEKYLHSDSNTGGSYAETEFCTKYETTEDHILNKDYIDVARRWGAGKYRITIRMQNKIVDAFDQRISAAPATGPVVQQVNPADPNSPQFIIQTNGDGQTQQIPMSIKDIMKTQREALKEQLEMAKLMREAYGFAPEQPQQQPRSEEEILASAILKQPDVIENVVGSVIKRFGGKGDSDGGDRWADVAMELVKTGQAAQVVKELVSGVFNGFGGLFPGRQQNGQAQMDQAQFSQVQQTGAQVHDPATGAQALENNQQSVGSGILPPAQSEVPNQTGARQITPEEQALAMVINHCARKVSPQITYDALTDRITRLDRVLDAHAFQTGEILDNQIAAYLELFATMPVDQALEFVKTQPNGEQVVALEHARTWTEELQKLIKSQEVEE